MKSFIQLIGAAIACAFLFLGAASPAYAIDCKDGYQKVKGHGLIATPYCQDNYLAEVAREYGHQVSNREIRQNPNTQQEVCRHIGHDIRISQICDKYRNSPGIRPIF